jgi:[ribosomal protein S5]-alanine N-acetyltransferase
MPLFDFSTFPIIETERLVLRQITHADVPALFNIYGDAETMRYYAPPYTTIEESHDDVQLHKRRFREKTGIRWGITLKGSALKGSDTLIGNCGYNPRVYGNRSDIGYILSREHWRKGIMYEAVRAILPFGFHQLEINRIEA